MSAHTPEELSQSWARNFNDNNLEGLVALFEPDALFMPQPGKTVSGDAAIREAHSQFLSMHLHCDLQFQMALESSGLALLFSTWILSGTGPDGKPMEIKGQTSDVARKQSDGSWLFVIDNPFGGKGVAA